MLDREGNTICIHLLVICINGFMVRFWDICCCSNFMYTAERYGVEMA